MDNCPIVSFLNQSSWWDWVFLKLGLSVMKFKPMEQTAQKSCVSVIVPVSPRALSLSLSLPPSASASLSQVLQLSQRESIQRPHHVM